MRAPMEARRWADGAALPIAEAHLERWSTEAVWVCVEELEVEMT